MADRSSAGCECGCLQTEIRQLRVKHSPWAAACDSNCDSRDRCAALFFKKVELLCGPWFCATRGIIDIPRQQGCYRAPSRIYAGGSSYAPPAGKPDDAVVTCDGIYNEIG